MDPLVQVPEHVQPHVRAPPEQPLELPQEVLRDPLLHPEPRPPSEARLLVGHQEYRRARHHEVEEQVTRVGGPVVHL